MASKKSHKMDFLFEQSDSLRQDTEGNYNEFNRKARADVIDKRPHFFREYLKRNGVYDHKVKCYDAILQATVTACTFCLQIEISETLIVHKNQGNI